MEDNQEDQQKTKHFEPMTTRLYEGILFYEHEHEEIANMETFEDDIWVCSFPRSGTTLTQELTYVIQTLDFETATSVILDKRFPEIDYVDHLLPYSKGLDSLKGMSSPRFIKAHLHYFMLPKQLKERKGKIIYIARNPKDVVCSWYKFQTWTNAIGGEGFPDFVDKFVAGKGLYCPWQKHVLGYWEHKDDPNLLFLKYEDVIKDKPKTIRRIAAFLGCQLTKEDVTKVAQFCEPGEMRNRDAVNLEYWQQYKVLNDNAGGRFINKGQSGGWKELLTTDMSLRIDGLLKEFEGTGLSFDDC